MFILKQRKNGRHRSWFEEAEHTQCGPKVLGLIFLKIEETCLFLIQNKLHWPIYGVLHGRKLSEKLPKIPLSGLSLIHQLRLLGSQQHPQSGVLLTSFSTWGTEYSLVIFVTFLGSKIGKNLQFCGQAHYRATRKNLDSRTQLDEPAECASGGDPLLLYKILHLLFFPPVRILCALRLESRKKFINMVLMRDLVNFSFSG